MAADLPWTTGSVEYALRPKAEFHYRNIIQCIQYLLEQRAFVPHMVWEPVKVFNKDNERIYSEMNTASWWWDQQSNIPVGSTLIPVLLASDQIHLTNFSGDKKLWPLYMSIGNIKSTVRNKPTMNAWIPIAPLPVSPKRLHKIPNFSTETQELDALQLTHEILSHILSPLANAKSEMVCCDENMHFTHLVIPNT